MLTRNKMYEDLRKDIMKNSFYSCDPNVWVMQRNLGARGLFLFIINNVSSGNPHIRYIRMKQARRSNPDQPSSTALYLQYFYS